MNRAITVLGLGFGDEGKGSIVDYLAREHNATTVVRFNGGAQAAHNVIAPDGRHHTFAQFGSGTFIDGCRTFLGEQMLVNPLNLFMENEHLIELGVRDALDRLVIHPLVPLTTPFHVAANRLRELARGDGRHGSCGLGIGETRMDVLAGNTLRAQHLNSDSLRDVLQILQTRKRHALQNVLPQGSGVISDREAKDWWARDDVQREWRVLCAEDVLDGTAEVFHVLGGLVEISDNLAADLYGTVIFEGAQGVLLDEAFGFQPYTTWTDCTRWPVDQIIGDYPAGFWDEDTTIGVMRAYGTRHGPGPFPTYDEKLTRELVDEHNEFGQWQREFRIGWPDLPLAMYSLAVVGGVDSLAITHLDRIEDRGGWRIAVGYMDGTKHWMPEPLLGSALGGSYQVQEQLTERLERSRPIYHAVRPDRLVSVLEERLERPASILSYGPKAEHKRALERVA